MRKIFFLATIAFVVAILFFYFNSPTDSTENTLYFGRNIRQREGITFVEIKMEDNPAGNNGDKNSWNQAFNCKNKTWRQNNVGFVPIKKGQVNFDWFKFACKRVVNHTH